MKNNIRPISIEMKMSQEKLADKCKVTRQNINAIENNKYDPTLSLAFKLSKNLSTKVERLFIFEEETE